MAARNAPDNASADELGELIDFLTDPRPQIKRTAVELVQGLTGSPEGIARLSERSEKLLPALFRLVGADTDSSKAALVSLVNLSQEPAAQRALLDLNAAARCMDYLREKTCPHTDLLVMLLANLTSLEEGAAALLQLGKGPLEGLNLAQLLKLFLSSPPLLPGAEEQDPYGHVATILPNVTRFAEARRLLLQPGRGLLRALASQLTSRSELRRRGCAGAVKNCCFSAEEDGTLEHVLEEREDMLGVLCGMEAVVRDSDNTVREALAEAVLCLARTETGRKRLWELKAPELLGKGYEDEEHPGVCAAMEATAELFIQDGLAPGDEEGAEGEPQQQQPQQQGGRLVHIEEID